MTTERMTQEPETPSPEPVDPEAELIAKARALLGSSGRSSISVYVRKNGADFPHPLKLRTVEELNDLPGLIHGAHGSGDFDYRVRVGGAFASGWLPISIARDEDEDEERDEEEEDLDEELDDEPEPDLEEEPAPEASPAEIAKLVLEQIDARERAKHEEAEREAARMRPLLEKISALEQRLVASAAPAQDPKVSALEAQVAALTKALDDKAKSAEDAKFQALKDEVRATRDLLEKPKKAKQNPFKAMLETITQLALVDKTFQTLKNDVDDDEEGKGGILQGALSEFENPLRELSRDFAKEFARQARAHLKAQRAQEHGKPGAGKTPQVPPSLPFWIKAVFENQSLVTDVGFIRETLKAPYAAQIEKFASSKDKPDFLAVVASVLNPQTAEAMAKDYDDVKFAAVLALCSQLRKTIVEAKKQPVPPPQAASEPEEEDEEEGE